MATPARLRIALFALLLIIGPAVSLGDDAKSRKEPATYVLAAAQEKAKADGKAVFLSFGSPGCVWCKYLDAYHARPAVQKILDSHLVFVKVDVEENQGGVDLYKKYTPKDLTGVPIWIILAADGKVLADCFDTGNDGVKVNVGFPGRPGELAHYEKAMRLALPKLPAVDLEALMKELRAAGPKREAKKE